MYTQMASQMEIKLDVESINNVDLSLHEKFCEWTPNSKYFQLPPGQEHYKLIAYLASQIDGNVILDIGHYQGMSSIALAHNPMKIVKSYDIANCLPPQEHGKLTSMNLPNVALSVGTEYVYKIPELVEDCSMVVLDIDHNGVTETLLLREFVKAGFKGIMICDDIYLNDAMKRFWNGVTLEKHDISKYGHWSGTGLINFAPEKYKLIIQ
jgi:hypothetical protein